MKRTVRYGQLASASLVSLAHGTNDAQETMGVVTLALIADAQLPAASPPPLWVIAMCGIAIALGTYLGGWRVIRTVGHRLTTIEAPQGFAAETASTTVLLISTHGGAPLSTTQITTGSVIGTGIGKRAASIRWGVAARMVGPWIITIPAAAGLAALIGLITHNGNTVGVTIVTALAAVALGAVWLRSRRNPVNAGTSSWWRCKPPRWSRCAARRRPTPARSHHLTVADRGVPISPRHKTRTARGRR